jgi:2-succinyl-5-enolpyruvyl-6-hydroxy-3-cyclohexene-1-carboxylate synthase
MNEALARATLDRVVALGVREFCVCPGSRNAPWVQLLAQPDDGRRAYYFFEERSAAFFALGRIRATARPVAVVTTSGTAAAELLPAVMEARYSGLPLVIMTADRPRRFRGTGAPQTAQQVGLYGIYAEPTIDVAAGETARWPARIDRPLHLNVCFEEPTLRGDARTDSAGSVGPFADARNPVVIVGGLTAGDRPTVTDFLLRFGAPAYLEAPSGLRECQALEPLRLRVGDGLAKRARENGYPIDGLLRIGSVPTHRFWRDLDDRLTEIPVCSVSRLPFPGLARHTELLAVQDSGAGSDSAAARGFALAAALQTIEPARGGLNRSAALLRADADAANALDAALLDEPRSEPGMIRQLSDVLPDGAQIFVGNSLPVREWDLAANWRDRGIEVRATRGVNGIDGQISSFLGQCDPARGNWALIGDLTALYDMAGPWILPQLDVARVDLVVLNNGGGRIFERMYSEPEFQNTHDVSFEGLAAVWGMQYVRAGAVQGAWRSAPANGRSRLIELLPDSEATRRFWRRYLG